MRLLVRQKAYVVPLCERTRGGGSPRRAGVSASWVTRGPRIMVGGILVVTVHIFPRLPTVLGRRYLSRRVFRDACVTRKGVYTTVSPAPLVAWPRSRSARRELGSTSSRCSGYTIPGRDPLQRALTIAVHADRDRGRGVGLFNRRYGHATQDALTPAWSRHRGGQLQYLGMAAMIDADSCTTTCRMFVLSVVIAIVAW